MYTLSRNILFFARTPMELNFRCKAKINTITFSKSEYYPPISMVLIPFGWGLNASCGPQLLSAINNNCSCFSSSGTARQPVNRFSPSHDETQYTQCNPEAQIIYSHTIKKTNTTGKPQGKSGVIKQGHRLRHTSRGHYTIANPRSDRTNNFTRKILLTVAALQGCVEFRPACAHTAQQTHSNSNLL